MFLEISEEYFEYIKFAEEYLDNKNLKSIFFVKEILLLKIF